ncbi:hypothetical protein ACFFGV_07530 [Pontibacillus salicampi]|uniref:Spore coat protein n=1 Tax=Pontibacillus salicampi TaxID=1449801 RepID=A0ABV6LM17_9BACI
MPYYNPYYNGWNIHAYRHPSQVNGGGAEHHGASNAEGANEGMHANQSSSNGGPQPFPGQTSYMPIPPQMLQGDASDIQYVMQLIINLGNQIDMLNQVIAQNNQLLQTMHDQEETKCVQGTGGGAVIVRM